MDSSAEVPKLIVTKGLSPDVYCIMSDSVSVGRALSNDIQITAEGVSRTHARIVKRGYDYFIVDLRSTNGIFINGNRIQTEKKLEHGDTVELGRTIELRFEYHPASPPGLGNHEGC